jgi:hypothetical protein
MCQFPSSACSFCGFVDQSRAEAFFEGHPKSPQRITIARIAVTSYL